MTLKRPALERLTEEAAKARGATKMRDHWIGQARVEGASLRTIGAAAGLTPGAVAYILRVSEAQLPRRNH